MHTVNTVVRNKYRTQMDSTVRKHREIFTMLGDPEQIVSDNGTPFTFREFGEFCINTKSAISGQHPIILQRMERLNGSSKCSNELFVRISILPRTVLLPRQANSIQSATFIVFVRDIVPYPTLLPDRHHRNYYSVERFERHSILSDLSYSVKSQVVNFVQSQSR